MLTYLIVNGTGLSLLLEQKIAGISTGYFFIAEKFTSRLFYRQQLRLQQLHQTLLHRLQMQVLHL